MKTEETNLYEIIMRMMRKRNLMKKSDPRNLYVHENDEGDGSHGEILGPYYTFNNMRMNRMAFTGSQASSLE